MFAYDTELFQIDEGFAEDDLEANLQRDKHARLCTLVNQLIDEFTPAAPDFQLQEACNQLVSAWISSCITVSTYNYHRLALHPYRRPRNAITARFFPWNACDTGSLGGKLFKRGEYEATPYCKPSTAFPQMHPSEADLPYLACHRRHGIS